MSARAPHPAARAADGPVAVLASDSTRVPSRPAAAPSANEIRWPFMVIAAAAVGIATWLWLRSPASPAADLEPDASQSASPVIQVPAQATPAVTSNPAPRPPDAPDSAPTARPRAGSTASGKLHLELPVPGGGQLTSLDMAVADGVAVWQPRGHRLRVLLVDEAMSPSDQRQMLDYLQSERLADSGRAYAVLELQFRPNAKTFDRDGLEAASLSMTNSDGTVSGSTNMLESLKWRGTLPRSTATGESPTMAAGPTLEMSASGAAASPGSPAGRDSWQLSVAIPVTQAR